MIDLTPNVTLIYQIILIVGLWLALETLILDRTTKLIEERGEKTQGALHEAQRLRAEAASLQAEYGAAMAEVRRTAAAVRDEIRQQAQKEEHEILEHARREAATALEATRAQTARQLAEASAALEQETVDLANRVVDSVLHRN